jgi:hypothetical protein
MAKRAVAWLVGLTALAALLASGATAGKPVFQRIDINETTPDPFLTAECGVAVTTQAFGHVIRRVFDGTGTGTASVSTINVGLTATAGDNVIRFRDVGADVVRIEPDGTAILMVIGQVPYDFTGVLKIDLETGDAILEPQHSTAEDLEQACATLTG